MADSSASDFALGVDADDEESAFSFADVDSGVLDREEDSSLIAATLVELISCARSSSVEFSRLSSMVSPSGSSGPFRERSRRTMITF